MRSFANTYRARGARRAYTHEDTGPESLSPKILFELHERWRSLEDQIEALQNQKKAIIEVVRSRYGRHQAEAVRITMRWMMTDPAKRQEKAMFEAMARQYVDLLENELEARQYEH